MTLCRSFRRPESSTRPSGRTGDEDDDLQKAIAASMESSQDDVKRRSQMTQEEDDLARALRMSEEEDKQRDDCLDI